MQSLIETQIKAAKAVTTVSSIDSSGLHVQFMNQVAQAKYDTMPDRFRELIDRNNQHLSLIYSVVNLPSQTLKSYSIALKVLGEFVRGDRLQQCIHCFAPHTNLLRH